MLSCNGYHKQLGSFGGISLFIPQIEHENNAGEPLSLYNLTQLTSELHKWENELEKSVHIIK